MEPESSAGEEEGCGNNKIMAMMAIMSKAAPMRRRSFLLERSLSMFISLPNVAIYAVRFSVIAVHIGTIPKFVKIGGAAADRSFGGINYTSGITTTNGMFADVN